MAIALTEVLNPSLAGQQLALSELESYFVADDQPEYPMTFFVMVTFSGWLDCEAFTRAMRTAIARHPLLRSHVGKAADGKQVWKVHDDLEPVITWVTSKWPTGSPEPPHLDLHEVHGLHTWIEVHNDQARIAWQFHHACADGLGAMVFVDDVLVAYASELGWGDSLKVRPIDPQALRARLKYNAADQPRMPWRTIGKTILEAIAHLINAPIVLQSRDKLVQPPQAEGSFPHFANFDMDEDLCHRLRDSAAGMEATFNDVLLAVLYQTLAQWQQQHPGPGNRLRVLMPTNLREEQHAQSPACNVLGYTFWDRKPKDCLSATAIVPGIVAESGANKKYRLGCAFLDAISVVRALGLLPRMVRIRRSEATVVFSNPGDLTRGFKAGFPRQNGKLRIGNLVFDEIDGSVPLRPGTRLCVLVTRHRRQYRLTWITDPKYLSTADRAELMQMYAANLHAFVAEAKPNKPEVQASTPA